MDVLPWWQDACISAGLPVPDCHGVDISLADGDVGGYVAKWGMENELTKSMVKRGREGNLSPWDFLRSFVSSGESLFSGLFREYASVFRGKKQLVWSIGLRDLLGLGVEETDKEVVERIEEGSELVGFLSLDQWRRVYRYEKRSEVLQIALNGINAVYAFIESLDGG